MSGEHTVTAALFDSKSVMVQGFEWCREQPKAVGIASLTKNILCSKHNSLLSEVDEEALKLFKAFRECLRLNDVRRKCVPGNWTLIRFSIDGWRLERWFLKTLINLAYLGIVPIGAEDGQVGIPTLELVRAAFGRKRLGGGSGLYTLGRTGENILSEDRVHIKTLLVSDAIMGAEFAFRGYRFLINLRPEPIEDFWGSTALHRSSKFVFTLPNKRGKQKPSHRIDIKFR